MIQHSQWLHGAYLKLANNDKYGVSNYWLQQTVGWLKIKALFGTQIALSDAQLNDSYVIMHLFSQPRFRSFISKNPDFLELIVHKSRIQDNTRFGKVTTSIAASQRPGWISSTFQDPSILKNFGRLILESGEVDIERELDTKSKFNRLRSSLSIVDQNLLEGLLYATDFFTNNPKAKIHESALEFDNMYAVLLKTYDTLREMDPSPERATQIIQLEKTLTLVNSLPPERRQYQSDVFTKAAEVFGGKHPNYNIVRHTAHHAWNTAIENTLGVEMRSLGFTLSDSAVQVGLFFGIPIDTFIPPNVYRKTIKETRSKRKLSFLKTKFDPTLLDWVLIGDISNATKNLSSEFQQATMETKDRKKKVENAIDNLAIGLNSLIAPKFVKYPIIPEKAKWVWYFGDMIAILIPSGVMSDTLATGLSFMPEVLEQALRYGIHSRNTNVLRKWLKQSIPQEA